jgi:RNA recognition motif-containing protein
LCDPLGSLRRFSYTVLWPWALASCSDDLAIIACFSHREHSVNIFVGNLAYTATENDLRQLFEPYGVVDKIQIITDRDTGRAKGFGFVEMPESQAAQAAVQGLQGTELAGRALTVNEAKPREPRREPSRSRW